MSEFFTWLSNNPIATTIFVISFAVLVGALVATYSVAFYQGREISFWPPKIGTKPEKVKPPATKNENKPSSDIEILIDSISAEIKHDYQEMKKWKFEHYEQIANLAINELPLPQCRDFFRELAQGAVSVPAQTKYEYGFEAFGKAEKSIKTIHSGSMDLWNTNYGQRYFRENQQAVARNIEVIRIFALNDDDIKTHLSTILEQERAGIKVFLANPKRLDSFQECTLIDDRIALVHEKSEQKYQRERIVVNPVEVEGLRKEYSRLLSLCKKIGEYQ